MSEIGDELRKVADEWDVTPLYALANRIDAEMAELPRGKDGRPIRVTNDTNEWRQFKPEWLTHERPDSWERIANELDEWRFEHMRGLEADDLNDLSLFADRIRRLAEMEDKHERE